MTGPSADAKAQRIVEEYLGLPPSSERRLVAIAGPPAAGKSTVAELVRAELEARGHPTGLLPMDGFHLDNETLEARGLLPRKGAPQTFDLEGFAATLARVKSEADVKVPTFDRTLDRTVPDKAEITASQNQVVVEGNYLLLDEPGWRDLLDLWDFSVFIDEDLATLEARLLERWRQHGLSPADAKTRAEANDIPNAKLVLSKRLACSLTLPAHEATAAD